MLLLVSSLSCVIVVRRWSLRQFVIVNFYIECEKVVVVLARAKDGKENMIHETRNLNFTQSSSTVRSNMSLHSKRLAPFPFPKLQITMHYYPVVMNGNSSAVCFVPRMERFRAYLTVYMKSVSTKRAICKQSAFFT